ncbi:protein NUCLEAR FUSION DEFECTIVE 6, chloroplastic/mitochondrial-like [Iris pallida]|uniref:Protein NUCLEAR FUSION DEFECTIVE 6, chloroplastic/mitochondrial-like n=1 Tax=Iris pallida TaxID=29817 RepID=A0AAX6DKM4_IRIPA|nr:protein NUCLEAR FUSION DEFECTIVE 6, chloroplastic/mitochondrial-like [Iris pallida]KAJ6850912.1 protein NUCLEAR FUSION DEFECTIVE 6, chloroplastic/mitochondrial-like [Iris pallida]
MSAPSLLVLLRSRVSLRSISLALKPTKKSIQSELSSCISNSRPQISSSSERRISLIARFDSLEWKKKLLFFFVQLSMVSRSGFLLFVSRLPTDSSCLVSMLPLHSAIAAARLNSVLSAESQSWGLVPQGISMPL